MTSALVTRVRIATPAPVESGFFLNPGLTYDMVALLPGVATNGVSPTPVPSPTPAPAKSPSFLVDGEVLVVISELFSLAHSTVSAHEVRLVPLLPSGAPNPSRQLVYPAGVSGYTLYPSDLPDGNERPFLTLLPDGSKPVFPVSRDAAGTVVASGASSVSMTDPCEMDVQNVVGNGFSLATTVRAPYGLGGSTLSWWQAYTTGGPIEVRARYLL